MRSMVKGDANDICECATGVTLKGKTSIGFHVSDSVWFQNKINEVAKLKTINLYAIPI